MSETKLSNPELNKKKEYKGIDIGKFLMAIIVIASHAELYSRTNPTLTIIYDLIRACVVPFFFLASGFFLYKENDQEEKLKIGLKKIIKLYITWNILYLPIAIYYYIINDISIINAILLYIRGFFLIGEQYLSWQLWYLLSFIYSIIVILILKKLKLSDKKILLCNFIIYLFGVTMTFLTKNYSNIFIINKFQCFFGSGRLFTGVFLIYVGMYIRKHNITISKILAIILIILCFIISVILPNALSQLILFISIFLLAMQINDIKINTINFRKSSTIIYFMHMWNLFILLITMGSDYAYGIYGFCINLAICIIESIIIICIQNKWNFNFINELFNWSSNGQKKLRSEK